MAALLFLSFASLGILDAQAKNVRTSTPPMGWNSYNSYSCSPSEAIIKSNAAGLVDLGLADLGYTIVTTDCGWPAEDRDSEGRMQWNSELFPSGGQALGEYIHGLGLKFGLYSGAGYLQCGSTDLPASLGYETIDAETFADWGGDSLKYDNCFADSNTTNVDYTGEPSIGSARFVTMADALDDVSRDMYYFICQWGVGYDVGSWASAIGDTWRISNDIYNAWRSIWRITNEVVPYWNYTGVGAYADMDMLIVGLGALSYEEERFHFGMWALNKSPLTIGAKMNKTLTPAESLDILSNTDVIAIDQDSLGEQARLVRRYTEEEWDIWAGNLSGSRVVVGVANWKNNSQTVGVDLSAAGVKSATAYDVWNAKSLGKISGNYSVTLKAHELKLLVLSDITKATAKAAKGYYAAATGATLSGEADVVSCGVGYCLPVTEKVGDIWPGSTVTFSSVNTTSAGTKLLGIDFVNYDVALSTAWDWGSNTRNMTIAVNGGTAKRWAFPISGGDWSVSGRLMIEVDGFQKGAGNKVVFGATDGYWAPDLVGFELFE